MPEMPESEFDPRLKAAMAEILEVVKRYDVGAQLVLVSTTHLEFSTMFPKWSLIQWTTTESGEYGYCFNSKGIKFVNAEAKHKAIDITARMSLYFRDMAAMFFAQWDGFIKMWDEQIGLEEHESRMTKHDERGEAAAKDPRNRARGKRAPTIHEILEQSLLDTLGPKRKKSIIER